MNDTRDAILGRLGSGVAPDCPAAPASPDWTPEERLQRFRSALGAVAGEFHTSTEADWPRDVAAFLQAARVSKVAYAPGTADGRRLAGACGELRLIPQNRPGREARKALFEAGAGVTTAHAGIAETGSLVLWSGPAQPRGLSLVPPLHVALLRAATLYGTLASLVAEESWRDGLPSNVLVISGPSKTADIEQTLVYGVHGPQRLVVFFLAS